jgi:hypothetical protein
MYMMFFCLGGITSVLSGLMIPYLFIRFVRGQSILKFMGGLNLVLLINATFSLIKAVISLDSRDIADLIGSLLVFFFFLFLRKRTKKKSQKKEKK